MAKNKPTYAECADLLASRIIKAMDLIEGDYNVNCCAHDCYLLSQIAAVLKGEEAESIKTDWSRDDA